MVLLVQINLSNLSCFYLSSLFIFIVISFRQTLSNQFQKLHVILLWSTSVNHICFVIEAPYLGCSSLHMISGFCLHTDFVPAGYNSLSDHEPVKSQQNKVSIRQAACFTGWKQNVCPSLNVSSYCLLIAVWVISELLFHFIVTDLFRDLIFLSYSF